MLSDGIECKSTKKVTIDEAKNSHQCNKDTDCMTSSQLSNDLNYFEKNGRFSVSPAPPADEGWQKVANFMHMHGFVYIGFSLKKSVFTCNR